jgi:urea carboxylase
MVERAKQIEVPKYLRPRTDTPKLTVGHGGCFGCVYSVRGAGGYQMFGITPMPIYDPKQEVSYLRDFMIFFNPGDIVKFKPVDRAGYDAAVEQVDKGTFDPPIRPINFSLDEFHADPAATNAKILGALHGA